MTATKDKTMVKAKESLAQIVQDMYRIYHDLRTTTGIDTAVPELPVVRKALRSLGSSAYMAAHSLLDEYQSPDSTDRLGHSMKRLARDNPLDSKRVTEEARLQLMNFIRCNTKLKSPAANVDLTKGYGEATPKKALMKLTDIISILSTVGRDSTGGEQVEPSEKSGPVQQRHADAARSTRSPSRSNKIPKGSDWKPSLRQRYDYAVMWRVQQTRILPDLLYNMV